MNALHRLARVRATHVETDAAGRPLRIDGRDVETIRERWIVEEGWWTDEPVRRAYVEAVLTTGALEIVFHDLRRGGWHRHSGGRSGR